MERITSNQVIGLMEAYNAVYAPQINEEQIWEEVESWVNSLLEEGYDLSEYTWEEMYEEYIGQQLDEVVTSGAPTSATSARSSYMRSRGQEAVKGYQQSQVQSQADAKALQTRQNAYRSSRNTSPGATTRSQLVGGTPASTPLAGKQQPTAPSKYKSSSDGKMYANYNDALAAKNSRVNSLGMQQGLQRVYRAGGGDAAVAGSPTRQPQSPLDVMKQGSTNLQRQQQRPTPTPGATPTKSPVSAGTRPATTSPAPGARPTTSAPATSSAKTSPTPTVPARNGFGTPAGPIAAQSSVSSVTEPPSAPPKRTSLASQNAELRAMQAASRQRQGLTQSFDPFDVVLGHLIDEGYADTEESALQIMANMSEAWVESIVEDNSTGATKIATFTVGGQTFRDYNSDGLSDRQKRMKEFGDKRLRASLLKGV